MVSSTVLGKRAGPIEGAAAAMDTNPSFSTTPSSSSADSEIFPVSNPSSTNSSVAPQQPQLYSQFQPMLPQNPMHGAGPLMGNFAQPPPSRPALNQQLMNEQQINQQQLNQQQLNPQINQQHIYPSKFMAQQQLPGKATNMYGNDYFMNAQQQQQQQHPLFPQSPPQETYIRPSIEDFGEKRRKCNDGAQQSQQQPPQQQHMKSQVPQLRTQPIPAPQKPQMHPQLSPQGMPFSPQELTQPIHPHLIPNLASPVVAPPSLILQTQNPVMVQPQVHPHPSILQPAPQVIPRPPSSTHAKKLRPQNITLPKIVDGMWWEDCDDDDGHYIVKPGEKFASRYTVMKLLGQGTFGKVAQCYDEWTQSHCAIKIIRAVPKYRDASKIELRVLSMLRACDPESRGKCVKMQECFDYRNHVCIVTDLYDISVYDFLKWNQYNPFPGKHIQHFAHQILTSVAHIHAYGIVHTDLKPENVLLSSSTTSAIMGNVSPTTGQRRVRERSTHPSTSKRNYGAPKRLENTDVTLIDFGSAVFDDEYHSSVVSTRHYRAPEIIFGTGWSFPCDLWSIGCVLVELCTGRVLFETRDNLEHLHMMEKTLGMKFTAQQLSAAATTNEGANLVSSRGWFPKLNPLTQQAQMNAVTKMQTVKDLIYSYTSASERYFWDGFLDLVGKMMALDPAQRISARDALSHPWFAV